VSSADVFHIASRTDWEAAQDGGVYRPASLEKEGFIHCSTRAQVLATAARFYAGRDDLLLLHIDAAVLGDHLRYEPPVPPNPALGDTLFPHLYAPLPTRAVRAAHPLVPDAQGRFTWPGPPSDDPG